MAGLPPIYNPNPISIPASEQQDFPDNYIMRLEVASPAENGEQPLRVIFRPYDHTTGKLYPTNKYDQSMITPNIFERAAASTLWANVLGGLVTCASLENHKQSLINQIAALAADDPNKATLEAELATVKADLGEAA